MPKKTRAANGSGSAQSAADQEFDAAFEEAQRLLPLKRSLTEARASLDRVRAMRPQELVEIADRPRAIAALEKEIADLEQEIAQIDPPIEEPGQRLSGESAATELRPPVQSPMQARRRILAVLHEMGKNPRALEKREAGKRGIKATVKEQLGNRGFGPRRVSSTSTGRRCATRKRFAKHRRHSFTY